MNKIHRHVHTMKAGATLPVIHPSRLRRCVVEQKSKGRWLPTTLPMNPAAALKELFSKIERHGLCADRYRIGRAV